MPSLKRISLLWLALAPLAVASCASTRPRVVNHIPEQLTTDNSVFAPSNTRCSVGPYPDQHRYDCETGPLAEIGCDRIFVEDNLRGLGIPTAVCWKFSYAGLSADEYFRGPKGFFSLHERFVAFADGRFQLIRNLTELQNRFAPIVLSGRALSYAVAATGFQPVYGLKFEPKKRYFVTTLEDTFVTSTSDGFLVHNLVDYRSLGCGPHSTYFVSVAVTKAGGVKELARVRAFEDPSEDNLCVD
jgi:hypothetical protein